MDRVDLMSKEKNIISEAAIYAGKILKGNYFQQFDFHNYQHTYNVFSYSIGIGSHCGLNFRELEPVIIAAWFHDLGYSKIYKGHENQSIKMALKFLSKHKYDLAKSRKVISCIKATQMPQSPKDLLGMIICDADMYHLSTLKFFEMSTLLRKEWQKLLGKEYLDNQWKEFNLKFLQRHQYFTTYGLSVLNEGKIKNIKILENNSE